MGEPRIQLDRGTRIRETYSVVRYLGSGRFADVFLVRHKFLGLQAMKVLVADQGDVEIIGEAFREAFVLSKMTHPGIVRVFDAHTVDVGERNLAYLTMEYVEGGTLQDFMSNMAFGLETPVALDVCSQLCEALGHAHALPQPIVHRDVKPSNILIGNSDPLRVRIADFGLAKAVDRFTDSVASAGTLLYMAPESLRGFEVPGSDVFSLGLVLHELLTGVLPFRVSALRECSTESELRRKLAQLHGEMQILSGDGALTVGADVEYLVRRMLAVDLETRFESACEAGYLLERCIRVRATSEPEDSELEGRKAFDLAFLVARDLDRHDEAVVWLRKAAETSPSMRQRTEPFVEYFEASKTRRGIR